jgi:hypothetical protein
MSHNHSVSFHHPRVLLLERRQPKKTVPKYAKIICQVIFFDNEACLAREGKNWDKSVLFIFQKRSCTPPCFPGETKKVFPDTMLQGD